MQTLFNRYNRHLGVIGIVGLTLITGGFDLIVIALRGVRYDEVHSPIGQWAISVAQQFTPAPSATRAGSERRAAINVLYFAASALHTLLFALLAWWRIRASTPRPPSRRGAIARALVLAAQLLLALSGDSALLPIFAMQLALVLPLQRGLAWLLLQMLAHAVITLLIAYQSGTFSDAAVRLALLYLGMESILHASLFGLIHLATRERRSRRTLAAAHAELLATQSLLSDLVRESERLRIARDLHDSVGHHLTALKLHLDLAERQAGALAPASLHTASELAGALLAEVRAVVSTERHVDLIDLRHALATLCAGIPAPRITLRFDDSVVIASSTIAHTLFRCAQEVISNTVRHAGASAMTIAITRRADVLTLMATDDGGGNPHAGEGNGLRGMRERLALIGGSMRCGPQQPRGYAVELSVPCNWSGA